MTTSIDRVLYTARAHITGGREGGSAQTDDGHLAVNLSAPGHGSGTNPEQLFAVGWSACFLSAIKLVAARERVRLPASLAIDTEVDLGLANGGYQLEARITVTMPGIDGGVAQALVDGAHLECPYSKATHGNINVATLIVTDPAPALAM